MRSDSDKPFHCFLIPRHGACYEAASPRCAAMMRAMLSLETQQYSHCNSLTTERCFQDAALSFYVVRFFNDEPSPLLSPLSSPLPSPLSSLLSPLSSPPISSFLSPRLASSLHHSLFRLHFLGFRTSRLPWRYVMRQGRGSHPRSDSRPPQSCTGQTSPECVGVQSFG